MDRRIYIFLLASGQVDDVLFVQGLARAMGKAGASLPPVLIVHGSGEQAERRLEGEGCVVARKEGRLAAPSAGEARLVAQAIRTSNRKLVSVLTDAVVHAVGFQGTDRGLLSERDGAVAASDAGWLADLVRQGAVPVVSSVVRNAEGDIQEVNPVEVALALAQRIGPGAVTLVIFADTGFPPVPYGGAGPGGQDVMETVSVEMLINSELSIGLVEGGMEVLLATVPSFLDGGTVQGTRIIT